MADGANPAVSAASEIEIVDQIVAIPIDLIEVGDRLRPIDPVWAEALGAIMEVEGHREPISVCQLPGRTTYRLVKGGHRLEGRRIRGHLRIKAVIVSADKIERRMEEVSENLWRRDLGPLDRPAFVAELVELHKLKAGIDPAADGRAASAAVRWAKQIKVAAADATETISVAYGWAQEVGDRLGLTDRTIRNDLLIHRGLSPAIIGRIRGLPLASNGAQLRALAKLSEADQRAVVGLIEAGKAKGASEALGILRQRPKPDMEKKAWSAFFGGWSRMSKRRQREALRELQQHLPPGVQIVFDGDAS